MNRWTLLIVGIGLLCGCNSRDETSYFKEILSNPPYSSITDSIKKNPSNDELYFRRAVLLNKNDLPEPALADFEKAWSLKKEEKYAFGISAILLDKKPDSALLFLQDALIRLPQSILLRINLARAYDVQGKTDESLKACNDILKINPAQVDVLKMKAALLDKKGDTAQSIRILEQAYSLAPSDIELNYELAYKYAETKNPKVLVLCDSLAKKDSMSIHAEPHYYKGIYFANINEKGKALTLFDQAIRNDYYFLNAHIEKGRILYDQKKFEDAYKTFNLAMTISPKFADAYFWMAKCQQAMGQPEEAKLNYLRAYGLDRSFTEAKEAADKIK
jgi:tetratricopeptide (TPR) repeat protein